MAIIIWHQLSKTAYFCMLFVLAVQFFHCIGQSIFFGIMFLNFFVKAVQFAKPAAFI